MNSVLKMIYDMGCDVVFKANTCLIQGQSRKHLLLGKTRNGLYFLQPTEAAAQNSSNNCTNQNSSNNRTRNSKAFSTEHKIITATTQIKKTKM